MTEVTIAFGDRVISIPGGVFLALLCFLLILRYRRQVLSDRGRWLATFDPIQPSLTASRSPFDAMKIGGSGCVWSLGGAIVIFGLTLVGIDLLLYDGAYFRDILFVLING